MADCPHPPAAPALARRPPQDLHDGPPHLRRLRRTNPAADAELLATFVDSMRGVRLVRQAATTRTPFEAALGLTQRSLYVVVPWAAPQISDADMDLVRELT